MHFRDASILILSEEGSANALLAAVAHAGFTGVSAVNNLDPAVRQCAAAPPDLVLIDLGSRYEQGRRTCAAIRCVSNVPILVISALSRPAFVASLLDAGADDHLVKPVSREILTAHLRKLARRAHRQPAATDKVPRVGGAQPLIP